ncbi:PPE domain-containing protein [Actinosynnema sp. NPDC053489]|uniref:PPE domain-containing protein n=1 Tax=Actinosynnema sp. NPDC053489 TaxID=3363916 RepID=UPI0037C62677
MGDNRHGGNHGGGQGHGGQHHGGQHHGGGHDKPTDLGQKVDWMTYSHQQLWEMINTGVDLKAASSAQADWATVGKALGEVQELLAKAIGQSSQAWTGESAERAREALESVEKWALNTSEHADNVAKCIATEIEHVQTAREMMPPPAPAPPVVTPVADAAGPVAAPTPVAAPRSPLLRNRPAEDAGYQAPPSAVGEGILTSPTAPRTTPGAFTGIDSIAAPAIDSVVAADATHRQAAEVMAMFQMNSYEVDRTVPSFAPPTNPLAPPPPPPVVVPQTPPAADGGGGQVVVNNTNPAPTAPQNQNQNHTQSQSQRPGGTPAQFGRGGFAGGRGFGGGGRGVVPTPVGAAGGGGGGPVAGPGGSTGALNADRGNANPGSVTSQFQAPKSVTPQSGMIGAAPMAAPPPVAGGGNERDRNRPGYLEDDDNVFGVDRKAAPPVIGL